MILAAGLSPVWQQIMCFDGLTLGEVQRARQVHWCASGKVLNAALALEHLGAAAKVIAPLGGYPGELIEAELAELGLARRWVRTNCRTRICTTAVEPDGRCTELVENAAPLSADELAAFAAAYLEEAAAASAVVLIGSLPAGAAVETYRELLGVTPCPAIVDCRGPELLAALAARPFCVKPNREELARTCGRALDTAGALHAAMRELNERGAEWVVITAGQEAVWASSRDELLRVQPPTVAVVNPIASGDCLAAGMAWGLVQGRAFEDALRLGVAAASENVRSLLPGRIDPQRVLAAAEGLAVERA